jgi:hypothetical protein
MAAQPLPTGYTRRELTFGRHVATGLWLLSGVLLVTLVFWTTAPR